MRNVYLLTKVGLLSAFSGSTKKKRRLQTTLVGSTALLGSLLFMAVMGFYGWSLSMILDYAGVPELLISGGLFIGLFMSLITGITKIPGALFAARDYEMLASLPVTNAELFLSKLLLAYTFSMTGIGGVTLPFCVVYGVKYGASFGFYLAVLAGVLIAPMLVCAAAGVVAMFISRIASRSRASNIVMLILSLAFVIGIMFVSMSFSSMPDNDLAVKMIGYRDALKVFLPTRLFSSAVMGDYVNLFWLLLLCGVPFGLFAALSAGLFKKSNIAMGEKRTRGNFKAERLSRIGERSVGRALFARELNSYFSFYGYVLNTAVGAILMLIFTAMLVFGSGEMFGVAGLDAATARSLVLPIFVAMMCYCVVLSPPTATGISIEGNRLWILRSLPVSAADIFKAKLKLQLLINWPVCVICSVVASLYLKVDALAAVMAVLLPMAYSLLAGLVGLVTNLLLPMLNWKNPMVPVKRSGSVFLCMVIGIVSLAVPAIVYGISGIDFVLFGAIVLVAILGAGALVWRWLTTRGAKRFYAL